MIKVTLTNAILKRITAIEQNKFSANAITMPAITANRLSKNSKKKSSYASNKIEGNPLSEEQANQAIESDPHRHFLKPAQEIRNYFLALGLLEEKGKKKVPFSKELILEVQALVEKGASKEKIGLRGAMPSGVLFAVYDAETGIPEYIPPEYVDIPDLLEELVHWRSILPTMLKNTIILCKWVYRYFIMTEERIRHIPRYGLIIFCEWLNYIQPRYARYRKNPMRVMYMWVYPT